MDKTVVLLNNECFWGETLYRTSRNHQKTILILFGTVIKRFVTDYFCCALNFRRKAHDMSAEDTYSP